MYNGEYGRMTNTKTFIKAFYIILLTLFILIFCKFPSYSIEHPKQNVLILNSYHKGLKWSDDMLLGIESALDSNDINANIYIEYMDTKRYPNKSYTDMLYNLYKYKYINSNFSVILTTDNDAFNFMLNYGDKLFPKTPVIFCGVNSIDGSIALNNPLFTGISEQIDIHSTLDIALKFHPKTKRVIVLSATDSTGLYYRKSVEKLAPKFDDKIDFIYMDNINFLNDENKIKSLSKDSIILLGPIYRDNLNNYADIENVADIISKNCSIPIYSTWEVCINHGVIGGKMISSYSQGRTAGILSLRILNGEYPWKIPIVKKNSSEFIFDFYQLYRFNISEKNLPRNSIIKNSPGNYYKIARELLWGFVFLLIIVSSFLIRNIFKRKQTKKALDEMVEYDTLKNQFFANISHELKTPLNVILSALQYCDLIYLRGSIEENKATLKKYKSIIKQNSYRLLKTLDDLIDITKIDSSDFKLTLGNYNIVEVVEEIALSASSFIKCKNIELIFDTDTEEKIIACDPYVIERIVLNLLSNSIKFTNPSGSIWVNVHDKDDFVEIIVKDTGIGIAKDKQEIIFERFIQIDKSLRRNTEGSGIGLSLVKSLVELHEGTIKVQSEVNKGSEFVITLPSYIIPNEAIEENIDSLIKKSNDERVTIEFSDIYL